MRKKLIVKFDEFAKADGAVRLRLIQCYVHGIGKRVVAVFFGLPLVGMMYLLKPIVTVRIGLLFYQRVGHLCANTEFWLKKQTLVNQKQREFDIFIAGTPLANKQLLTMIKRHIFVLEGDFFVLLVEGLKKIIPAKHWMWIDLTSSGWNSWDIWNGVAPQLSFIMKEHQRGQEALKAIGIQEKSYVCFHARDNKYLNSLYNNVLYNWEYHDYRDTDINNFVQAFNSFASPALKALRMGAVVGRPLVTENHSIIDYATKFRTDFSDVYVMAHCKFFVGDTAGIYILANLFKRPVVMVDMVPVLHAARGPQDIFIPKKYWHISKNRLLTFREIREMGTDTWYGAHYFEKAGIRLIENTSQEILAATQEMNARLDGTWTPQEGDESLQQRFRERLPCDYLRAGFCSRIGAQFLRDNEYLLE